MQRSLPQNHFQMLKMLWIVIVEDLVVQVRVGSQNSFHGQGADPPGLFGGFAAQAWAHGLMIDAVSALSVLQRPRLALGNLSNDNGSLECFGHDFGNAQERSQDR